MTMIAMPRRAALLSAAGLTIGAVTGTVTPAAAEAPPSAAAPFALPPLPYDYGANEPYVDAETMQLHHDRHHAAYVANLNAAVKDYPQVAAMLLPEMLARVYELPEAIRMVVRNNAGGHANHAMFWQVMGGKGGAPEGELAEAIARDFGGFEALKAAFAKAGLGQFGSGWVMVTVTRAGRLGLMARPNQDTPLMEGGRVLFGNDLWEHAYYLTYRNRRADYLAAWWNVLDWRRIAQRYAAAKAGTLEV
jgi:Fe-Mn family superoxide dismutase